MQLRGSTMKKPGAQSARPNFVDGFDDEDERKGRQRTHRIHGPLN
jgi:hypothetical protein